MLSLISFSFIFCIMTSSIMQLNASALASSCLNFTRTRDRNQNHVNNCTEIYRNYTINFKAYSRICIQCTIIYTKITIDPNCSMAIKCVILIFDNNGVLETFFKDRTNNAELSHLFLDKVDRIYYPSIDIIVNNYNITDITSNYIGHIANIDAPNTNIHIKFIKRSPGLLPLTVTDETYYLRFPLLTISVQCDDSNSWATYAVYGKNSTPTRRYIERNCIELQSTTQITTLITTTPETTTRSTTLTTSVSFITTSSSTTEKLTSTTSTSSKVTTITSTTTRQKSPTTSTPSKLTTITTATTTKEKTGKTSIEPTTTTRKILTITTTARRSLAITTTTTTKFPTIPTTATTTTKASLSTRTTSSSPRTTKTILTSMKTASTITATTTTKASLSTRTTSSSPRTTKTISTSMKTASTITAITSTLLTITTPSTTSFTTTIVSEIETSTATTDNSFTMSDTSAINTLPSPSPISTLTSEIIESILSTGSQRIIPTTISQITSTMIAQTSHTTASTSSFITTTSELMEGIEKIPSRTTIQITLKTETILSAVITKETPTVMSRSSTISTNTGNLSFTSTTSTQRSQKSRHILLYILFSLLSVIICVTIAVLIAYLLCCRRQARYFIGEDSSTLLDPSNRDTYSNANNDGNRPESASNTSSSLSSTLYDETKISTKPNINFGQIFDDDSF